MISIIKNFKIILILFFISLNSLANDVIPVDIIADEMQWNDDQKIAYAIGNAIATQGIKTLIIKKKSGKKSSVKKKTKPDYVNYQIVFLQQSLHL